ncbi:GNAT family N-acetyltransferase [Archangium gephyra]|nr:GNAT family N-acetyltransferase [Archangium gephyra]
MPRRRESDEAGAHRVRMDACMPRGAFGFCEDGYRVTWMPTRSELLRTYRLRADVFCRELRWVGSRTDLFECDEFDDGSTPIVVVDPLGEVAATARLVGSDNPWMFDRVFQGLCPPGVIRRNGAMEASRLTVAEHARGVRLANGKWVSELVFKAVYALCAQRGVRYVYMVTSDVVARLLRSAGLPCETLAPYTRMPDGVRAAPLMLDWGRLDGSRRNHRWYEEGLRAVLL